MTAVLASDAGVFIEMRVLTAVAANVCRLRTLVSQAQLI